MATANVLARAIWNDWEEKSQTTMNVAFINKQIWWRYAICLHEECCLQVENAPRTERAWTELHKWLLTRISGASIPSQQQQNEDIVQETIIRLQKQLRNKPLHAPRTLFAMALQTLRNTAIDMYRHETAVMRGGGNERSLEDLGSDDDEAADWDERLPEQRSDNKRPTETAVANREVRQQLDTFFQQHLNSDLQIQLAQAHFLDGLSPKEIAQLWEWTPARVRVLKARIVQRLRSLSQDERAALLHLLDSYGEVPDEA